ncbi:MAG: hypothetical protein PHQ05_12385 [Sterolibacterium sp.]|nr:hypothetical protein [Sterolibacterium sp.]
MKRLSGYVAVLLAVLLLAGCLSDYKLGSAADPPRDIKVQPGNSSATVTWTGTPGVRYWLFSAQANDVTPDNWNTLTGGRALINVSSPILVTGLTNGLTYSFTVNGRIDNGQGGAGASSISAVPRPAGATWTRGTQLANDLRGGTFGTLFVAVGAHGALYSSPDFNAWTPMTWTTRTNPLPTLPDLNAAVYNNAKYLTVGAGGVMLSSSDAMTWTAINSGTTNNLYGLATNPSSGWFVAVGEKGTIIVSGNGTTWTTVNSGTTNDLFGVTYGNGAYVAVGANGTMLSSVDGTSWVTLVSNTSRKLNSIAYGVNATTALFQYVAVGDAGTMLSSANGSTWVVQTPLIPNNLNAVTFNGQFVAIGDSGALLTSVDGSSGSWQAQASGTTNNLTAIFHNLYGLSAVGMAGTNLTSL